MSYLLHPSLYRKSIVIHSLYPHSLHVTFIHETTGCPQCESKPCHSLQHRVSLHAHLTSTVIGKEYVTDMGDSDVVSLTADKGERKTFCCKARSSRFTSPGWYTVLNGRKILIRVTNSKQAEASPYAYSKDGYSRGRCLTFAKEKIRTAGTYYYVCEAIHGGYQWTETLKKLTVKVIGECVLV